MIRSKLGLLGLCAAMFGVMAFTASFAQAETGARWLVLKTENGALLSDAQIEAAGEKFEGEIENGTASLLTKVLGIQVQILCTTGRLFAMFLTANASTRLGTNVEFEGCVALKAGTAEKLSGCLPHSAGQSESSGRIVTQSLDALAELHSLGTPKDDVILILPFAGGALVNIFMGESCAIGEQIPIFGKLAFWDCEEAGKGALVHKVSHLITEFKPLTKLYAITDTAEHLETRLDGSGNIRLFSFRSWAVSLK